MIVNFLDVGYQDCLATAASIWNKLDGVLFRSVEKSKLDNGAEA